MRVYLCPGSLEPDPITITVPASKGVAPTLLDGVSPADYVASAGPALASGATEPAGVFFRNSALTAADLKDGAATTILVGERSRRLAPVVWSGVVFGAQVCTNPSWPTRDCTPAETLVLGRPGPAELNAPTTKADGFAGSHSGGGFFVFGDASAHFLRESINPKVFTALTTRNGGETVGPEAF